MCCLLLFLADTPDLSNSDENDDDDDGDDDDDDGIGDEDDEDDAEDDEEENAAPAETRKSDSDPAMKRRQTHDRSEVDDQHFSLASMEAFTQQVRRCTVLRVDGHGVTSRWCTALRV